MLTFRQGEIDGATAASLNYTTTRAIAFLHLRGKFMAVKTHDIESAFWISVLYGYWGPGFSYLDGMSKLEVKLV